MCVHISEMYLIITWEAEFCWNSFIYVFAFFKLSILICPSLSGSALHSRLSLLVQLCQFSVPFPFPYQPVRLPRMFSLILVIASAQTAYRPACWLPLLFQYNSLGWAMFDAGVAKNMILFKFAQFITIYLN